MKQLFSMILLFCLTLFSSNACELQKIPDDNFSEDVSKDDVSSFVSEYESFPPSEELSENNSEENSGDVSENSSEEASKDLSNDMSNDESKDTSNDESKDTSNDESEDTSNDESKDVSNDESEEESKDVIIDVEGYEQFLKVSEIDETLLEREFKDFGANKDYLPLNYDIIKACWISQFDFDSVYYSNRKQRSQSAFTSLVEQAYDNLLTLGFNTVIVQIRPNTDSFYPSAYYPWSSYVVYQYGKYGSYDPLEIMIREAHERGLSFHAWINPMRGMSSTNLNKIDDVYPMTKWIGTRKLYNYNSINYLNIAYDDVRQLIINGAAEIVRNYDVDAVHMDDYFYFGETTAFDNVEYNEAKASNSKLTLRQFRYNNLNTLVSGIYSAIKAENPKVLFGISPAGNINNMATTYYADVETWLSEDGYLDYIMPQIYFGMEHATWSFSATYERWSAVTTNPNIKFTCGMTFGKAVDGYDGTGDQYAGSGKNEWINNKDVFKKCFEYALKQDNFGGYAVFCYQYMFDPNTGVANIKVEPELENCREYMTDIIKGEVIEY
ncbi:MAG: family 10 glycosylhydrolase [Clostridia bacterium]|nr:family 10 glycosylhydrolase [Clostridia bacterium]